jgi:hypothetical protein
MYDNALGRFYGLDALAELTPSITPNHFGNDNPVYWSDPSGLWSSQSFAHADKGGMSNDQWLASQRPSDSPLAQMDAYEKGRIANQNNAPPTGSNFGGRGKEVFRAVTVDGDHTYVQVFYESYFRNQSMAISHDGGFENSKTALEVGGDLFEILNTLAHNSKQWLGINGKFNSIDWGGNGYTGGRSAALQIAKRYKYAKWGTIVVASIISGIEVNEGYEKDGKNFGYTAQRATAQAVAGVAVGWAAGALTGAAVGSLIPVPVVGTIVGAIVGGVAGYYASEGAGSLVDKAYE